MADKSTGIGKDIGASFVGAALTMGLASPPNESWNVA